MSAREIIGARVKTDAESEARARRPGMRGAVLRVAIAIAVTLLSATVPVLVMAIPGVGRLLDGKIFGWGTAGLLVVCLAALAIMSTATLCAFICTRLLITRLDHASPVGLAMRPSPRALAWCVGMIAVAFAVMPMAGAVDEALGIARKEPVMPGDTWWSAILIQVALGFLLQGIPEELVWRGWLFRSLGSTRVAAVVTVLAFTVMHLVSQGGQEGWGERVIYLAMPFGFGAAAMAARWVSGSTWAAVGAHGGFHLSNLLAVSTGVPVDEPVTWVVIGCLWLVAGVVVVLLHKMRTRRPRTSARSIYGVSQPRHP
ncbi:CPBP family intramembrane glutamic endopeptidase [Actinomyces sp. 565]|uniref:CPBP family intramembrane glutamic endopeptidase n=1 Tax=Actinomyces sp. 565 TaxID=2057794 RepID=UPI0013A702FC|nr:CPBP family intramembrane glutamic endopeptidase [Actinomyces sp. 565]NDR53611.1 CPBP family intramembrane metalloprotease [Actinomyces sp. 565]